MGLYIGDKEVKDLRMGLKSAVAAFRGKAKVWPIFSAFLRVSPDEPQWITDDMGVDFRVESNTDWIVETDSTLEILAFLGNNTLISNDVMLSNGNSDVTPIVLLRNDKYIRNGILYKNE